MNAMLYSQLTLERRRSTYTQALVNEHSVALSMYFLFLMIFLTLSFSSFPDCENIVYNT